MNAIGLMKLLEYFLLLGFGNPWTCIAHREVEDAVRGSDMQSYFTGIGELDRVAQQVEQYLGRSPFVPIGSWQSRRYDHFQGKLLLRRQRLGHCDCRLHSLIHRVVRQRELEGSRFDLGKIKHIVDEPEKVS